MDSEERSRLRKAYAQMSDEELIEMLLVDKSDYAPCVYELLQAEGHNRGLESKLEEIKKIKTDSEDAKSGLSSSHCKAGKFVRLMKVATDGDVAFLKSLLDTTGIPYYFQTLRFRFGTPDSAPAHLLIEESRLEEAKELLKEFNQKN